MASLADVFVAVTGDLGPLRQAAQDGGQQAGQTAAAGFRGKFEAGIKIAAAAGGALIVAGLAGAIARSNTTSLLAAQVGAAGPEMAKLGKLSGELYAGGYGASIEEVNDALRTVIQNGLAGVRSSEADIKRVAGNVSNLTTLLGEDAGRVSSAIQQMLRTGLAKTADEAFDILTKATQNGINKSEDLLDTLNEYGTEFRELGLDGPRALGLISQAIQAGARDSDTAADALKEFSILAQDGSKKSADAFAALGINAQQAFAAVASGGAPSAAVLDQVLDKLQAMPASAERTALAVALFGTKAEDLGDALFAMDLDTAAQQFGTFEGAAQKAGDTLANSAGAQVEAFKRQVEQGLIDAVARAIPTLQTMFGFLSRNAEVIGPLVIGLGGLAAVVWTVNAAITAWTTIQLVANAVASTWLFRTILINAQIAIYLARMAVVRAATVTWTAIQWLLNAAFVANPIGLIVLAIAALVAGVILAYKHSETFRNIVQGAWEAIKTASAAVWGFIKPIFEAWLDFAQRMGAVYLWLWRNVIQPAMQGIGVAIQVAWAIIQVIFGLWRIGVQIVGDAVMWLYNNAVKPAMQGIGVAIQVAWTVIKAVWDVLVGYIRNILAPGYQFLWNAVKTVWNGIASTISSVWSGAIKPVFDVISNFITQTVPAAFRRGVDLIGFWWNALRELAATPVRFVIGTIVNKGIIGTFNKIAGFFGQKGVSEVPVPFADGGPISGPGGPRDDVIPAWLSNGEYVIPANIVKAYGVGFFNRMIGRPTSPRPGDGSEGLAFADGGLVGLLANPVSWIKDRVSLDNIPGGGIMREVLVGAGGKMITGLIDWAKSKIASFVGGTTGFVGPITGSAAGIATWLRAQHGKPYGWAQAGPGSYDCSGIVSAVWNLMHGANPYRHTFSTHGQSLFFPLRNRYGLLTAGWANPGEKGGGSVGHTAANFAGIGFESSGSRGVRVGAGTTPVTSFAHWGTFRDGGLVAKVFDTGGIWRPGEVGVNLGSRNELVVPDGMSVGLNDDSIAKLGRTIARALTAGMASTRELGRAY